MSPIISGIKTRGLIAPYNGDNMKKVENVAVVEDIDPDTFEFKTIADFDVFNKWARKNGHPVRVPDGSYYKSVRVKFQRFDQPDNVLKARVRNRKIDWSGQLIPGQTYDLPQPVVKFLNGISEPIFSEIPIDGSKTRTETKQTGEKSRFSCQVVDFGED